MSSHKYAFRKLPIHVSEERLAKFSSIKKAKFNRAASMQHTVLDFEMLWREKKAFLTFLMEFSKIDKVFEA